MRIATSGDFTVASAVGAPRFERPFRVLNEALILRQDFMQFVEDFEPLAFDTPHPDFTDYLLVDESPHEDMGGQVVKWTRTYAKIPSTFSEWTTDNYTFPGIVTSPNGQFNRELLTKTASIRTEFEFFLVAAGETYETPDEIPVTTAFQIYQEWWGVNYFVNSLLDGDIYFTVPDTTEYLAMVAAGDEIVVRDSTVRQWIGNIYMRETSYTKAQ